jgi:hypothetical protein
MRGQAVMAFSSMCKVELPGSIDHISSSLSLDQLDRHTDTHTHTHTHTHTQTLGQEEHKSV